MYQTLCRAYIDPDGPIKEKKASKPYKEVMREHEGVNSFLIIITPKDNTLAFKKAEKKQSKNQETGYEGDIYMITYIAYKSPSYPVS